MNKLKKSIALYFNLSKKETNGFVLLCLILLIFLFASNVYRSFLPSDQTMTLTDQKTLDSLACMLEKKHIKTFPNKTSFSFQPNKKKYSLFDPNFSTEEEMINAGVSPFISKRIVKFRSKGGFFKKPEELKKIYGLSETDYQCLFPYIELSSQKTKIKNNIPRFIPKEKIPIVFNINTADSLTLISLKGIGPVYASRIIKYRTKLGGYINLQQLKEVYGLDSITLRELQTFGYIDQDFTPKRININVISDNSFLSHPYVDKKSTRAIVNYRLQHGRYSSLDELKNIKSISEQSYQKMFPYLTVE